MDDQSPLQKIPAAVNNQVTTLSQEKEVKIHHASVFVFDVARLIGHVPHILKPIPHILKKMKERHLFTMAICVMLVSLMAILAFFGVMAFFVTAMLLDPDVLEVLARVLLEALVGSKA